MNCWLLLNYRSEIVNQNLDAKRIRLEQLALIQNSELGDDCILSVKVIRLPIDIIVIK